MFKLDSNVKIKVCVKYVKRSASVDKKMIQDNLFLL